MFRHRTVLISIVILLLAAGVGATVLTKRSEPAAQTAPAALEFLQTDVAQAKLHDLRQTLPLSGSLRAVNQAAVKAKVACEVR